MANCSALDDIIVFYRDGHYKITRVQEKLFVGKNVLYVDVYRRKDERLTFNVIYQTGRGGVYYMKRFRPSGLTRDKDYELVKGLPEVRVAWFTANPNGEAETVKVALKPKNRLKTLTFDVDFAKIAIKGRGAQGNLVTKNEVQRFSLKEKGVSTLGGRQVWFDFDVMRLNYDGRGTLLGEFSGDDRILVILPGGEFYLTGIELTNHYEDRVLAILKYDPATVWTAVVADADMGYPYLKRFTFEASARHQRFIGENPRSTLMALSGDKNPEALLTFADADRAPLAVDAAGFVGVKSFRARGKRLTMLPLASVELRAASVPEDTESAPADDAETTDIQPETSEEQ